MADNDKIGANLPSEFPNFLGRLAPNKFCHGIEAKLPQSGNAFFQYFREVSFHSNGRSSKASLGHQQCIGVVEDR